MGWQNDSAAGSGEDMEMFSYLSRWWPYIKNMLAYSMYELIIIVIIYVCVLYGTGREEYLTEAVIFWNRQKSVKLPNLLVECLAKAHNKFTCRSHLYF